ncbi:MAG: hypothetical protein ABIC68_05600 [Candidatus Omnitrophota bacterium]
MRKIIAVVICWALLLCIGPVGSAQVTGRMHVLKGQVAQLHWVTSTLVVRWLDGSRFDETTFIVEKSAKIFRNGKAVTLSSLNHGDQITVEYYEDGFEGLKAVKISIIGGL